MTGRAPPPRIKHFVAGLVVLAIWVPLVVKGIRNLDDGNDFTILLDAARSVLRGDDLYGADSAYMYPPTFAFLLVPFAPLPDIVAGSLWVLLKVPLFYYSLLAFLPRRERSSQYRFWLMVLAPLPIYRFLESDLVNGNTNVLILAGVAGLVQLVRRGRDLLAGIPLALVAAIKLSPAYLLLVTAVAGKWRSAWMGSFALVVLLLLPAAFLPGGVKGAIAGFRAMNAGVLDVGAETIGDGGGYLPGQSLRPLLHRYLRPIDATAHDKGRHVSIHWMSLDPQQVEMIYRICATLLGLLGVWGTYSSYRDPRDRSLRWAVAWGAVVLLLISPYSRKAHFLLLFPAYALLFETVLAGAMAVACRREVWGCLGISIAAGQLTTPAIWGKANSALLVAHGSVGLSAMVILPAMWIIRRHERTD